MDKKSYQRSEARIPDDFAGIQVNTCKNPSCDNFGKPPLIFKNNNKNNDSSQQSGKRDKYYALHGLGKGIPGLKCKSCEEITPIKSNQGIEEERSRLGAYLNDIELTCPNSDCSNHFVSVYHSPKSYSKFGSTNGNQRYQCRQCKKTFSNGSKRRKQKRSEVNKQLYTLLMNKVPIKRCCEILDISPPTFYHKLDWLYEQAQGFIRERERKLLSSFEAERLYLSTDRQVQTSNWISRDDKRNTEILALGTADNRSGYVFGWHFNYDPVPNPMEIERYSVDSGDYDLKVPFRRHARLWLERDYEAAINSSTKNMVEPQGSLIGDITEKSLSEKLRENSEAAEVIDKTVKPPSDGMLVHSEYTMYGHFYLLNELLRGVNKVRFYLDQEAGIRNAFMTAFSDRVKSGTADAFYVRATKEMTVDQKERLIAESHQRVRAVTGVAYASLTAHEKETAILNLIMHEMKTLRRIEHSNEDWLIYPFASKSEPEKMVAALTDISRLEYEHQARLYKNASLHGIDRFFMQARRRVNIFERPFSTGANARRTWYGYSVYNPANFIKMAELFRLFYNFIHNNTSDGKTPAMRLGLAKGPVSYEQIIYFDKYN